MEIDPKKPQPKGLRERIRGLIDELRLEQEKREMQGSRQGFTTNSGREAPVSSQGGFWGFRPDQEKRIIALQAKNSDETNRFLAETLEDATKAVGPKPKETGSESLLAGINYEKKRSKAWSDIVEQKLDAFESEIGKS